MESDHQKFYVTTPIYYPNAKPHVGSLYSTVLADVAARWHQLHGDRVFFLTGTDEHGQKIAQAAKAAGKSPQDFVNDISKNFKEAWKAFNINYSHFIRTTDKHHTEAVQHWLTQLIGQGDIYKSFYSGWYCVSCEAFVSEKEVSEKAPACPTCGRTTEWVSEESYFFKLSAYQDKLLEFYKNNPDFVTPPERLHEVIAFVESGLKDLSISRTTISWGIPFPGDEHHVTYVWADALNNYITGVGYGDKQRQKEFNFWWPCDLHVMGKDIIRFHAIYWPAFLMATGLELPRKLLVHGWIKVGEQKMSKSLGNVVDPLELHKEFGADPIRFYLIRHMAINQDTPMSIEDIKTRINSDLAHDLGNLLNRLLALAHKYSTSSLPAPHTWGPEERALQEELIAMVTEFKLEMGDYYFHRAYARVWKFIHTINAYFHAQEPWKVAGRDREKFVTILSATAHTLYACAALIWPVMPQSMTELCTALGVSLEGIHLEKLITEPWKKTFTLTVREPLFKQYELTTEEPRVENSYISFEDFTKVDLRVGTIEEVSDIPGSEKLYKLMVNFGELGMRQICSGVKQHLTVEDLRGKQAVFVANLAPRKIMGIESQGMLLVAENDKNKLEIVTVAGPVVNGARIR